MPLDPTQHLGLARLVASRFRSAPDREAVVGAAVLALVENAPDFEEDRGIAPSSFLWFHLLGAAKEEARRQWRQEAERLYALDDDGTERERTDLPTVAPTADRDTLGRQVREAVAALPPREARIVTACYGLDGTEPLTLAQVAQLEGLSRARVQQLRVRAEERLRQALGPRRRGAARGRYS